jgi:hypothetical protein
VAVIGVLQVSDLFGMPEFLLAYYDQPFEGHAAVMTERATSTVASAFGLADLMIMNIVIVLAKSRVSQRYGLLFLVTIILLAGCIAAGEFSGYVGLVVALFAFGVISGRFHQLLPVGIVGGGLAALFLQRVIASRLEGFQGQSGVPESWAGRWDNLQTYFFPDLFNHGNWFLGVRPAPRILAFETWREWVYLESGYLWLLWIGGIPFLAAFFFVTMLFDPHLTLRGSADLFFPLLALSLVDSEAGERRACVSELASGAVEPAALIRNSLQSGAWVQR